MFRRWEVRLALPVVYPLVERIRNVSQSPHGGEPSSLADLQELLGRFDAEFARSGRVFISERQSPAVLRACSFLRFELRRTTLSSVPDIALESGQNVELPTEELKNEFLCYAFLATFQEVLLKQKAVSIPFRSTVRRVFGDVSSRLGSRSVRVDSRAKQNQDDSHPATKGASRTWLVVVGNDPVNLMTYVTAALRHVLGISERAALDFMFEIHEAKRSVVWKGKREMAESRVRDLRSWHLDASLQGGTSDE